MPQGMDDKTYCIILDLISRDNYITANFLKFVRL